MYHGKTIGVVIPAHNEAQSIGLVVRELAELSFGSERLVDNIVVCDNASSDATILQAQAAGALVVSEPSKGYGAACLKAMAELAEVDCIAFVDGDHSVLASELSLLLDAWRNGAQLVIGTRTLGAMESGALTPHQRWGNALASFLLTRIWSTRVTDLGPFRVIGTECLASLNMRERTFGWTVEMQAKALAADFRVTEVPVTSLRRIGVSKVSGTWRGSVGAGIGILSTIVKIGAPELWARWVDSLALRLRKSLPVDI